MKTMTRIVLAGSALATAGVANAALINVMPTAAGGSDLVLFVTDTTGTARFFVQDLGVQLDSLGVTTASVQADQTAGNEWSTIGNKGTTGPMPNANPVHVGAGILSGNIDTALAAFTSGHTSDTYVYTIMAAGTGDGTANSGQQRALAGYTATNGANLFTDEPASTPTTSSAASGTNTWYSGLNAGTVTGYAAATGAGLQALNQFGLSRSNGSNLGTTQFLYELATFNDGVTTDANVYAQVGNGITINVDGSVSGLTSGAAVPLPAGVWLLGSGLLGLLGIGRRRNA
jgi:hypothetical protein